MKIRTKLRIGTVITAVLVIIYTAALVVLLLTIRFSAEKQRLVERITHGEFQSSFLRGEYVQYPSERPKEQWVDVHERQSRLLDESTHLFTAPAEKKLFDQIVVSSKNSRELFDELIRNVESGGSRTVIQELNNQLSVKTQTGIANALLLAGLSRQNGTQAARTFALVVILLGLVVVGFSILSYITSMSVAASIRQLGAGTKIIAAGNFSYELQIRSRDEIGELAALFNAMAAKLKELHSGLEAKVSARTKDLEKARIFLDAIIENIPNMIFLKDAKELRFVRFNKAGEELLGYKRGDLLGKNDYDFFPKDQADFFIKKDRAVLTSRRLLDIPEEPIETKSRGRRWLHTKKIPLVDARGKPQYLLGISEDITERRSYDQNLRLANEAIRKEVDNAKKFQQAVEAAADAIVITDASTNIVYVNPAWELLTGYSQKEVMGMRVNVLKSASTSPAIHAGLRAAIASGQTFHSDEIVNVKKDGSTYDVDLTIYPVRVEGVVQFFVGVHTDITARKRSDRAKTEFVSLASHQLRTPLTEIRWALSSIARECPLEGEHKETLEAARAAVMQMAETIHAMLLISHVDSGNLHTKGVNFPLRDFLDKSLHALDAMRSRRGIRLEFDCPADLAIHSDEQLLREMIANLVSNAYKYTQSGGTVTVRAKKEKTSVRIDVRDTGIGIPALEQGRVGQKFFRAANVLTKEESGTGLGLYLVYSLAEALGATVSFTSQENAGTTFTLHLPPATSSHA